MRLADAVAIDCHVHPATREWLVDSMGPYLPSIQRYFRTSLTPRSVEEMADEYRAAGVVGILLAWDASTHTGRPAVSNERIAEICSRHPDCFVGFGSVDPHRPDAPERVRALPALGLRGLKIHPTLQGFDPSDPRFDPYFAAAAQAGLPVITHAGTSGVGAREPGGQGLRLDLSRPILMDPVAARYPELRILLAHVGWPWHLESLAMALHKANVYLDVSGWKYRYLPEEVLREMRTRLQDQFCFGTDYPMFRPADQLQALRALGLPADVERKVLRDNALRFLGEPSGPAR